MPDLFSHVRSLALLGLAFTGVADWRQVEEALNQEIELHQAINSPPLRTSLESETTHAILRQLKVRILLRRNNIVEARAELKKLEDYVRKIKLTANVLNLDEERSELLLREKNASDALPLTLEFLQKAVESGDLYSKGKALMSLGICNGLQAKYSEAIAALEEALALCEKHQYRLLMVDILFHLGSIFLSANLPIKAYAALARAGKLAQALELHVRADCFRYIRKSLRGEKDSPIAFFELLKEPKLAKEAEYYLDYYGFLSDVDLLICNLKSKEILKESALRQIIRTTQGLYWFFNGCFMAVNKGKEIRILAFDKETPLRQDFLKTIAQNNSIDLEELHQLGSSMPYHPLKHAGHCKMLLTRLRKHLDGTGIEVVNHKWTGLTSMRRSMLLLKKSCPSVGRATSAFMHESVLYNQRISKNSLLVIC